MADPDENIDTDWLFERTSHYSVRPRTRRVGRDILLIVVLSTTTARVEAMHELLKIDGARFWSSIAQSGRSVLEDYITLFYCTSAVVIDKKSGKYEDPLRRFKDFSYVLIDDEFNHWGERDPTTEAEATFKHNFDQILGRYATSSQPFKPGKVHPWSGRGFRSMASALQGQGETLLLPIDLLTKFYKIGSSGTHLNPLEYDDFLELTKTELNKSRRSRAHSLYLVSLLCLCWMLAERVKYLKPTHTVLEDLAKLNQVKTNVLRVLASK